MLSSPVYAESHPPPPLFPPYLGPISFCSSQPSNLPSCQHENDVQTPSNSSHPWPLLSRQHHDTVSPLAATLMNLPASVANKRLTAKLTPLDATLTKNRGGGAVYPFLSGHQIPVTTLFSTTYKLPIFYPLCFDIHPWNGGVGGRAAMKHLKNHLKSPGICRAISELPLLNRSSLFVELVALPVGQYAEADADEH